MAKQLKCWIRGKRNPNRWFSEKRKEIVEVIKFDKSNDYWISVDSPSVGKGIGNARNKSSAIKKAKTYMRKHNTC